MASKQPDLAWRIGGPQGSGVDTAAQLFSFACAAGGLVVFGRREYYSNIMGRHSYYDVRVANHNLTSHRETIDLLASFEAETLARHAAAVVSEGAIIYNTDDAEVDLARLSFLNDRARQSIAKRLAKRELPPTTAGVLEEARQKGVHTFGLPYDDIVGKVADNMDIPKSVAQRASNTVAVAASIALLGYVPDCLVRALEKVFPDRTGIIRLNVGAAELTYDFVQLGFDTDGFGQRLMPVDDGEQRVLVSYSCDLDCGRHRSLEASEIENRSGPRSEHDKASHRNIGCGLRASGWIVWILYRLEIRSRE